MDQQILKNNLSKQALANILAWLDDDKYSCYHQEIKDLIDQRAWLKLEDSFYKDAEFGTAGIRGKTGVGTNRINKFTISNAAQGFCQYLLKNVTTAKTAGVVIAYDSRNTSKDLSNEVAKVIVGNGLETYLFDGPRSTPELSFAVRFLKTAGGIVISASHNPPSDNGFKAYTNYGGQLVAPMDKEVVAEALSVQEIKVGQLADVEMIGTQIDKEYVNQVIKVVDSCPLDIKHQLKIVFSPLHGTGQTNTLPVLIEAGFNVDVVESQMSLDGNFPTLPSGKPNPQEPEANELAIKQMIVSESDITITNDPDADRLGVCVNQSGKSIQLDGNQTAILIFDYILNLHKDNPANKFVAKTIVTTDILTTLANYYGIEIFSEILVGFKFIGQIAEQQLKKGKQFLVGGEESNGILVGNYARDKDAASGSLVIAQYAAQLKQNGKTLYDRLLEIYQQHGIFIEKLLDISFEGAAGFAKMQDLMFKLRNDPIKKLGNYSVTNIYDYQNLEKTNLETGAKNEFYCFSKGNVLVYQIGDNKSCRLTIRPSGTEPKIKLYLQWFQKPTTTSDIETQISQLTTELNQLLSVIQQELID